ncbi:MAG: secondary thiamine-phosphate synthase enzyme YjbQ [Planctomycetota bacterium]
MRQFTVVTESRDQFVDITQRVAAEVEDNNDILRGLVTVFVPHTTAGVTINENADPDVKSDMLQQLDTMVPWSQPFYRHAEGNSAAHVKASMMGSSVTIPFDQSRLVLGRWQGIYLCEFDGPRERNVWVRVEGATTRD